MLSLLLLLFYFSSRGGDTTLRPLLLRLLLNCIEELYRHRFPPPHHVAEPHMIHPLANHLSSSSSSSSGQFEKQENNIQRKRRRNCIKWLEEEKKKKKNFFPFGRGLWRHDSLDRTFFLLLTGPSYVSFFFFVVVFCLMIDLFFLSLLILTSGAFWQLLAMRAPRSSKRSWALPPVSFSPPFALLSSSPFSSSLGLLKILKNKKTKEKWIYRVSAMCRSTRSNGCAGGAR